MMLHTYTSDQCAYQVSTSYTLKFPRYSPNKILQFKVTIAWSKAKSRLHHDVAHLNPHLMSLPSFNFLHLMVSKISPGQTFSCCLPTHLDTMGEENTHTALKGCGVKRRYLIWPENLSLINLSFCNCKGQVKVYVCGSTFTRIRSNGQIYYK